MQMIIKTGANISELQDVQKECSIRNLSVLAYANGFTLWHYKADALADATIRNYFVNLHTMLAKGDMIIVSAQDGTRTFYVVSADAFSVVISQT